MATLFGEKKIGKIKQKLGNKKMLRKRKYPGKSERKTCKIMPESWCNIFFLLLNTPGLFAAYGAKDIALLRTDGLKLSIQHPLHALGTKKSPSTHVTPGAAWYQRKLLGRDSGP